VVQFEFLNSQKITLPFLHFEKFLNLLLKIVIYNVSIKSVIPLKRLYLSYASKSVVVLQQLIPGAGFPAT
jgi:hypothetical protein